MSKIFKGYKIIIKKDSSAIRKSIYTNFLKISLFRRCLNTFLSFDFICFVVGIAEGLWKVLKRSSIEYGKREVHLISYDTLNEKKALKRIEDHLNKKDISTISSLGFHKLDVLNIVQVFTYVLLNLKRIHRISKQITGPYPYLKVRGLSFLVQYIYCSKLLRSRSFKSLYLSNDSSPEALSLIFAAQKNKMRVIYIGHGFPDPIIPSIDFDITFLYGEKVRDLYLKHKKNKKNIYLIGIGDESSPITEFGSNGRTCLLPLSLTWNDKKLEGLILELKNSKLFESIIIRPHTDKRLLDKSFLRSLEKRFKVKVDCCDSIVTTLKSVDLVICGNSSSLLDALREGVPTIYYSELDHTKEDILDINQEQVVLCYKDSLVSTVSCLNEFYSSPLWIERFRRYDFSYLKSREEIYSILKEKLEDP